MDHLAIRLLAIQLVDMSDNRMPTVFSLNLDNIPNHSTTRQLSTFQIRCSDPHCVNLIVEINNVKFCQYKEKC